MLLLDDITVAVAHAKNIRAISSLEGPHLDKYGDVFTPQNMQHMSLRQALQTRWDSDCFLTTYFMQGCEEHGWPRLKKRAVESVRAHGSDVLTACLAFDVDNPDHMQWNNMLFGDMLTKVTRLQGVLGQWAVCYTTRHGMRLIYTLEQPVPVEDAEQYAAYMFMQLRRAGIMCDENARDWTRLFRLPWVVRDNIPTGSEPYFVYEEREVNVRLDQIKKVPVGSLPHTKKTRVTDGQPTEDEVHDILYDKSIKTGNDVQSAFYKKARKVLSDMPYAPALFKEDVPLALPGQHNDKMMQTVGSVIPRLLREVSYLEPKHVYALLYGPILAFGNSDDWPNRLWVAITSVWEVEAAKHNENQQEAIKTACNVEDTIEIIAEGMKKWTNHPDLSNPETRTDYVLSRLFALPRSTSTLVYPIREDGTYSDMPWDKTQLIPMIRKSFLNNIVPTRKIVPGGMDDAYADMPASSIINAHSVPVTEIEGVVEPKIPGIIRNMDDPYNNPVLEIPLYCRSKTLEPKYDPYVDEWLTVLLGDQYDRGVEWIANALAFDEGPICALSIYGLPGTGKQLLAMGLSECLERPRLCTNKDVQGSFNGLLAHTPFLCINEEWPYTGKERALNVFKSLTGGDRIPIREMYKPLMYVSNPLRMILTANDSRMITALLDADLTPENRRAFSQRLLNIPASPLAVSWFEKIGNRQHTARPGGRWIAGDDGKSDFVVAKHFLHLYHNRPPKTTHTRFLVEGDVGDTGRSLAVEHVIKRELPGRVASLIIEWVGKIPDGTKWKQDRNTGGLLVTVHEVESSLALAGRRESLDVVAQTLRTLAVADEAVSIGDVQYISVDPTVLYQHARSVGLKAPKLMPLYRHRLAVLDASR